MKHYNLEEKVYIIGGSAGGHASVNFVRWHSDIVEKLQLLSAWVDLRLWWNVNGKDTFVEYLGFNNTSTYEEEKAYPYDPAKLILSNDGVEYLSEITVPINTFVGSTEINHPLYAPLKRFADASIVTNENNNFTIWDGKQHSTVVSGGDIDIDTAICDFFDGV